MTTNASGVGADPAPPTPPAPAAPPAPDAPSRAATDLGSDLRHFVDAVSHLAEATVRPVVRTLRVVGSNIGPERAPRVRFRGIEEAGTELVVSGVRLVERFTNLLLEITEPEKPTAGAGAAGAAGAAGPARRGAPSATPGETLRLPMSVENPSSTPMVGLAFRLTELRGPADTTLTAASIRVVPETVTVAPNDFEKVVVEVLVPPDATEGVYEARLGLEGNADFTSSFRFVVAGRAG